MANTYPSATPLDNLRINRGADACRSQFRQIAAEQRQRAVAAVNHPGLEFPTFYVLLPEIDNLDLYDSLSTRNTVAAVITARVLQNDAASQKLAHKQALENHETRYPVLKWILDTSGSEDGKDPQLDRIIDMAAAVLIQTYGDSAVLAPVAQLIFSRNRQGLFHHDLVWAFFRSRHPYALRLVAEYLRSPDAADHALAQKLLGPDLVGNSPMSDNAYQNFLSWLEENNPYLYFTGECFQFSSDPKPCTVNLDAKYLCKRVSPEDGKPLTPITEQERSQLENFHEIPPEEQEELSRLSNRMYTRDPAAWNKWIQTPVVAQVSAMKSGQGGAQWY